MAEPQTRRAERRLAQRRAVLYAHCQELNQEQRRLDFRWIARPQRGREIDMTIDPEAKFGIKTEPRPKVLAQKYSLV